MGCMYEYGQTPDGHGGFLWGRITTLKEQVKGCAAGSVWKDQGGGVRLASRTAESAQSVWRKINGSDSEWWENVADLPKGHFGPQTHAQVPPPPTLTIGPMRDSRPFPKSLFCTKIGT